VSLRLNHNLNAAYIAAANKLRPKKSRRRIVAYVESFDDVAFWRQVLDEFEDDSLYFEVMLPCRDNLGKGKRAAIMNILNANQLGTEMIACVDADYDWLLQDSTESSLLINTSPYIIHTYVYAIENYQCYAPGLHRAVVTATLNDRPTLQFEAFFAEYSTIVWPLFVWNVWGYAKGLYKGFSLSDFSGFISLDKSISMSHPEDALAALRRRVNQKMSWLQRHRPEARKSLPRIRQRLLDLGITPEETYLYIHGHTLFENVVLPLLTPICITLRKEREREIRKLAFHATQRQNELSSYQHSQMPIEDALRKGTAWLRAPQMERVRASIRALLQLRRSEAAPSPSGITAAKSHGEA
jgi:hypothetical protein